MIEDFTRGACNANRERGLLMTVTCLACGAELDLMQEACPACGNRGRSSGVSVQTEGATSEAIADGPVASVSPVTSEGEEDASSTVETLPPVKAEPKAVWSRVGTKSSPTALITGVVAGCAILDFLSMPIVYGLDRAMTGDSFLGYILASVLVAFWMFQFSLLAIWFVFAPLPLVSRVAFGIGVAIIGFGAVVLGVFATGRPYYGTLHSFWGDMFQSLAPIPLLLIAGQLGLWCLRFWGRWRIVSLDAPPEKSEHQPLRIQDAMIATVVVAVALAIAKAGNRFGSDADYLLAVIIGSLVVMLYGAALLIPAVWAAFRHPAKPERKVVAGSIHAGVAVVTVVIIGILTGRMGPPGEFYLMLFLVVGFHYAYLLTVLTAFRRRGYVLRWKDE